MGVSIYRAITIYKMMAGKNFNGTVIIDSYEIQGWKTP
jgi:hypothetical protein